jgi:thioesterase domain-containing protein
VTVEALLAELRRREVELRVRGTSLHCSAPPGALTAELREAIVRWKGEILDLLGLAETLRGVPRGIVPMEPKGTLAPVFAVGGHNGDVFCFREFARDLGAGRPFFGLEPPGLDGRGPPLTRIEDLACFFEEQIAAFRPAGACIIAGYCAGGTVAFELGRRLLQAGRDVSFVALLGTPYPTWYRYTAQVPFRLRREVERVSRHARALWSSPSGGRLRYVADNVLRLRARRDGESEAGLGPLFERRAALERATLAALRRYRVPHFPGRLALLLPHHGWLPSSTRQWRAAAADTTVSCGPASSLAHDMLQRHAPEFAALFRRSCAEHETTPELNSLSM